MPCNLLNYVWRRYEIVLNLNDYLLIYICIFFLFYNYILFCIFRYNILGIRIPGIFSTISPIWCCCYKSRGLEQDQYCVKRCCLLAQVPGSAVLKDILCSLAVCLFFIFNVQCSFNYLKLNTVNWKPVSLFSLKHNITENTTYINII